MPSWIEVVSEVSEIGQKQQCDNANPRRSAFPYTYRCLSSALILTGVNLVSSWIPFTVSSDRWLSAPELAEEPWRPIVNAIVAGTRPSPVPSRLGKLQSLTIFPVCNMFGRMSKVFMVVGRGMDIMLNMVCTSVDQKVTIAYGYLMATID